MTSQMPFPELPPQKPLEPVAPPVASSPQQSRAPQLRGNRLRQAISYVTGAGLVLVIVVVFFELIARPGLRPTDLMATIEARTELGIMNQKLGGARGDLPLTEADYQRSIAQAQREGQAKAEIGFQRALADVQADKEMVVAAYQTLYQRTNIIAQAGVQMEQQAMQFRQRLIEQTNGGRVLVLTTEDSLCAFGNEDACEKARALRAEMIDESTALTEGQLAKKVNELMEGIPDPAALVAEADKHKNGTPALQR